MSYTKKWVFFQSWNKEHKGYEIIIVNKHLYAYSCDNSYIYLCLHNCMSSGRRHLAGVCLIQHL